MHAIYLNWPENVQLSCKACATLSLRSMSGVTGGGILSTCPPATIAPRPGVPPGRVTVPPAPPADLVLLPADLSDPTSEGRTEAGKAADAPAETRADVGEATAAGEEAGSRAHAVAGTGAEAVAAADVDAAAAAAAAVPATGDADCLTASV